MAEPIEKSFELPERKERLTAEKNVGAALAMLQTQAEAAIQRRFASTELARESGQEFAATACGIIDSIENARHVRILLSGGDALVSNVQFNTDPDEEWAFSIDADEPFVPLGTTLEQDGFYYGLPLGFAEDEDGHYFVPHIVLSNSYNETVKSNDDIPIADVYVIYYLKAPLVGDVEFTIPELDKQERRESALAQVAMRESEEYRQVLDALEKIADELDDADPQEFIPLTGLEYLHLLGSVDGQTEEGEKIAEALSGVIGRGRTAKIHCAAYEGIDEKKLEEDMALSGHIVDVIATHDKLEITTPMLVMDCTPGKKQEGDTSILYYIPLHCIEKFFY